MKPPKSALPVTAGSVEVEKVEIIAEDGKTVHMVSLPQAELWRWAIRCWPGEVRCEYRIPVPGRRFRADIAFPALQLAVEVDGHAFHGVHYGSFIRDRERQNLMTIHGWRIIRLPAMEVMHKIQRCITQIQAARVTSPGYAEATAAKQSLIGR